MEKYEGVYELNLPSLANDWKELSGLSSPYFYLSLEEILHVEIGLKEIEYEA